jgi:hypothetical protein
MRLPSMPQEAETMTLGLASSMRTASSRAKAAEHHGMHCPEARTAKHCYRYFGNHRHINDDTVAFADAKLCERACKLGDGVAQFAVRRRFALIGDRPVE